MNMEKTIKEEMEMSKIRSTNAEKILQEMMSNIRDNGKEIEEMKGKSKDRNDHG